MFIPLLNKLAAKIEQISIKDLYTNPFLLAKSLRGLQELLKVDAIISIFDTTLEAEACGCEIDWKENGPIIVSHPASEGDLKISPEEILKRGRIPVVMEAIRQLKITVGSTTPIGVVITGPLTITEHLIGYNILKALEEDPNFVNTIVKTVCKILTSLCRQYCELNVDFIILADGNLSEAPSEYISENLSKHLRPFWNVARYHVIPTILLQGKVGDDKVTEEVFKLDLDGFILTSQIKLDSIPHSVISKKIIGIALPIEIFHCNIEDVKDILYEAKQSVMQIPHSFITTEWEVSLDVSMELLRRITSQIKDLLVTL